MRQVYQDALDEQWQIWEEPIRRPTMDRVVKMTSAPEEDYGAEAALPPAYEGAPPPLGKAFKPSSKVGVRGFEWV